jgi:ATP-dependent RNA helicase DeaD
MGDLVEQEGRDAGAVTRNQNALYVMPHDWASIAQFLGPLLDRVDARNADVQLLVVTPDAEVAAAVSASAVKVLEGRRLQILAATSTARALRLLRARPPHVLAGSASVIVELLRSTSLKLHGVKSVCIAWADEVLARGEGAALETLMAEVPKDTVRTIVTAEAAPQIDELVERYARRARRIAETAAESGTPMPVDYVTVSPNGRLAALRRVLDETNPASATIFVRDRDRIAEVDDLLRSMGYGDGESVRVGVAAAPGNKLVVLYDLPASREELREAATAAGRAIALVQPRQLASLRTLAAGGAIKPLTLPESGLRARDADARLRAELRAELERAQFGRALLAVEPLLDEYDGVEIAAAAIRLLEHERETQKAALAAAPAAARSSGTMVKLFVTVGERDGARPADLVGAIANQGGVSSAELGKVEIRESHSIVEVSEAVADAVIERVNGTTIKGRRAVVRRDEGRGREGGARESRSGESRSRDSRSRDSNSRDSNSRDARPRGRSGPPRGRGGRE